MRLGQVAAGAFLTFVGMSPLIFFPKDTLLPLVGDRVKVTKVGSHGNRQITYGYRQNYTFEYRGQTHQCEIAYANAAGGEGRSLRKIYVWPGDPQTIGMPGSSETWMGLLVMVGTLPFAVPTLLIGLFRKKPSDTQQKVAAQQADP